MIFQLGSKLIEKSYTKRDAFILLDCDKPEYYESVQNLATYVLLKKSNYSCDFVKEWLKYAQDIRLISNNPNTLGKPNYDGFIAHRNDQSILSLLSKKHHIAPFRDPSQYGIIEHFSDDTMQRSEYPQMIDSFRRINVKTNVGLFIVRNFNNIRDYVIYRTNHPWWKENR